MPFDLGLTVRTNELYTQRIHRHRLETEVDLNAVCLGDLFPAAPAVKGFS